MLETQIFHKFLNIELNFLYSTAIYGLKFFSQSDQWLSYC
jgi:hypothetical protein